MPRPARMLIVEDDPLIALDLELTILDKIGEDGELVVTDQAKQALLLAEEPLTLALLDVDVTDGKTFDLAARLAARGTPVVFVSGSLPSDLPTALCNIPFVRKPFAPREIERLVLEAMGTA